jgi:hypothetical protein
VATSVMVAPARQLIEPLPGGPLAGYSAASERQAPGAPHLRATRLVGLTCPKENRARRAF